MTKIRKALTAGFLAGVGAVGAAFTDGSLTNAEIGVAVGVAVTAALAVWRVPNANG